MRLARSLCLLLSAWLAGSSLSATPPPRLPEPLADAAPSRFVPLGAVRAFSAEVITEVMIDATGFLWIGTREGLFLHDGQSFRRFQH
ncbi:MAG TPA: hypothetical protein VFN29_06240 [Chiayiivirga sp.]|nr:hypothetical protein [Chiayiivirga sp.]